MQYIALNNSFVILLQQMKFAGRQNSLLNPRLPCDHFHLFVDFSILCVCVYVRARACPGTICVYIFFSPKCVQNYYDFCCCCNMYRCDFIYNRYMNTHL